MLPYPSPHRVCISQDPPQPNPTSSFPMAPAHLDQHYDHFFPGHGQFNSETLEAVLWPPRAAPDQAEVTTALPAPRNGVAAGGNARARKRPFRTDRHSKIRTAQGVRDRRMRLSLEVARDFFALQDRLGFDKASKTVDWLLTQSKPAIDRLSESSLRNAGGDTGMPSPTSAERCNRRLKEAMAAGSGKGEGDVEKVRARSGGSVLLEHGCGLNHVMSASMPGDYYYDYEEDGDFLDGMQY